MFCSSRLGLKMTSELSSFPDFFFLVSLLEIVFVLDLGNSVNSIYFHLQDKKLCTVMAERSDIRYQ